MTRENRNGVSDEIDALIRFYGGRKLISIAHIEEFSRVYCLVQKVLPKPPEKE